MKKYNNKANIIGNLLLEHRNKKGLSKEEVCRRVQLYGIDIHRVELYRMEKGKSIVIHVQDSPVKITFSAEKNEKIADMIKSTLLNAYSEKIC